MQTVGIHMARSITSCIYEENMNGADTKNRTRDLLITKHVNKSWAFINQSLTTLATAKTNVTQPQLMGFQPQSGTNLAQSVFYSFRVLLNYFSTSS